MSVKIIVSTHFAETYPFLGGKAVNRKHLVYSCVNQDHHYWLDLNIYPECVFILSHSFAVRLKKNQKPEINIAAFYSVKQFSAIICLKDEGH
jgi:hypothetical protein